MFFTLIAAWLVGIPDQAPLTRWSEFERHSESMEVVDLALVAPGVRVPLRLPRAYVTLADGPVEGRDHSAIVIDLRYPAMTPYTLAPKEAGPGEMNISMTLRVGGSYVGRQMNESFLRDSQFIGGGTDYHGLKYLGRVAIMKDGKLVQSRSADYYHYVNDTTSIIFGCVDRTRNPKGGCLAKTDINEKMGIRYIISSSFLHDWKEVDRKVREVVNSIVVK